MTPEEKEVFFRVHSGLPCEGPGSRRSTQKAFASIPGLYLKPRMLDMGCGPGAQTMHLAGISQGEIYAPDSHKPSIERLRQAVQQNQLTGGSLP